jgi:hypothetical protein
MSDRSRTIRLFLVNGNPAGLIIAEVGGWTGKVIVVPRTALATFLRRPEAQNVAVYLLSGPDPEDPFRFRVYVGESETIGRRLRDHDGDEDKDFFDRAIVFVSKDENLTRSHVRHLEVLLTQRITDARRTTLMHTNQPGGASLPEADVSDMELFFRSDRNHLARAWPRYPPTDCCRPTAARDGSTSCDFFRRHSAGHDLANRRSLGMALFLSERAWDAALQAALVGGLPQGLAGTLRLG